MTPPVDERVEAVDDKQLTKTIARHGRVDLLCIDLCRDRDYADLMQAGPTIAGVAASGPAESRLVSQYFLPGDVTLWNPSNGASALFLRQTAGFEEVLDLPSGIGPMEEDEARVTADALATFLGALSAWRNSSNHAVLAALSDGFTATMLVLVERAGAEVHWPARCGSARVGLHDVHVKVRPATADAGADWTARVREQARRLDLAMAR